MVLCNVKSFVYYEHHESDYVMEHNHNCYECVFYLQGKGRINVSNEVYNYDGPTITIVKPGYKHDETTEQFSNLFIVLFELNSDELLNPFTILPLTEELNRNFTELFNQMKYEEKCRNPYYSEIMNSIFQIFLCQFLRLDNTSKQNAYNKELVRRIKNYIKENYKQKINFEAIAASFGYSYDRLRHIFTEETNTSIKQYLLNCRLYAAKKMLLNTNMSIKEIAIECGFKSNVHFNNFFSERMNISPLKFRNSSENQFDIGVFNTKDKQVKKMEKILFIDTDLGSDCDDVGAIALANILQNQKLIRLIGMTHTTSLPWGPACIDIINKYYHNDIKIGATTRKDFCLENANKYAEKMANTFEHQYPERTNVLDAVKLIRESLVKEEDHSVTFVCIGQLNNASDLLDSVPDEYSSLNGVELVKQKVKEFVVMGGLFKEDGEVVYFNGFEYKTEYNVVCDIKSAQNFIKKVPVKVVFNDFKVGYQIYTAGPLLKANDLQNPITFSYKLFQDMPRESWDLLTVYYAALNDSDIFSVSANGTVSILDDGSTIFDQRKMSNHYYIRLIKDNKYVEDKINNLLYEGGIQNEKVFD